MKKVLLLGWLCVAAVSVGTAADTAGVRNALKPLIAEGLDTRDPIFDLRAERLGVEDFVRLTGMLSIG